MSVSGMQQVQRSIHQCPQHNGTQYKTRKNQYRKSTETVGAQKGEGAARPIISTPDHLWISPLDPLSNDVSLINTELTHLHSTCSDQVARTKMSLTSAIPPPKWVLEMNTPLAKRSGKTSFRNPPGFTTKATGKQVLPPLIMQIIDLTRY